MNASRRLNAAFALRDEEPGDRAFLIALYATTREDDAMHAGRSCEIGPLPVETEFDAQRAEGQRRHPRSRRQIIETGGLPIGRLWLAPERDALHVLDIALIPALRGCGIGTACLRGVLDDARAGQFAVRLQMLAGNRARTLVQRLGFVVTGTRGPHHQLRWMPPPRRPAPALSLDFPDLVPRRA